MSIKSNLQANSTDLQSLLDVANALPEYENLDSELSTQDDLIAQISAALEGKTAGGGSSVETCSVTIPIAYQTISFTQCVNGTITSTYETLPSANTVITDVVVGSVFSASYGTQSMDTPTNCTDLAVMSMEIEGVYIKYYTVSPN